MKINKLFLGVMASFFSFFIVFNDGLASDGVVDVDAIFEQEGLSRQHYQARLGDVDSGIVMITDKEGPGDEGVNNSGVRLQERK